MKPRRYSSDGIVLSRKSYGEADRIITVFSRQYGKLQLLAKGVRKPKSRKRGHIEVFSLVRFSAVKGKEIDLVTEVETLGSFKGIRNELKKVAVAYYFMETIKKLTQYEEKNEKFFAKAYDYLNLLQSGTALRTLKQSFIKESLVLLGFWPLGKELSDPDRMLEEVTERRMTSARVGKKLLE